MIRKILSVAVLVILVASALYARQEPQLLQPPIPQPQRSQTRPLIPIKVQLVISRYQGDKKVGNLPYTLWVTANGKPTSLRMGIEVPVSTSRTQASYQYRSVGTNIDCSAETGGTDQFQLNLTVSDSSVYFDSTRKPPADAPPGGASDAPSFRSFNSSFSILLRDGQSAQYTSATDPVSGEVMKIDVTLNILK